MGDGVNEGLAPRSGERALGTTTVIARLNATVVRPRRTETRTTAESLELGNLMLSAKRPPRPTGRERPTVRHPTVPRVERERDCTATRHFGFHGVTVPRTART